MMTHTSRAARSTRTRAIAVVGAPSAIGIRPYDDGGVRRLDLAPDVLRQQLDMLTDVANRNRAWIEAQRRAPGEGGAR